jgi:guanylate kinase
MGKSGCGKSTLERSLIDCAPTRFKKVVSSTTRTKRAGEEDGRDYYFLTDEEFDQIDFIQTTEFAGNRYGSSVVEYQTRHVSPILVVVPSSAKTFTDTIKERFPDWGTFNIYFNISNERLIANMRKRGDTEEMIEKRLTQDTLDEQFKQSGLIPNMIITDSDLDDKTLPLRVQEEVFLFGEGREIRRLATVNWNSPKLRIPC